MNSAAYSLLGSILLSLSHGLLADELSPQLPDAVKKQMLSIKVQNLGIFQELVPVINQDKDFQKDLSDRTDPIILKVTEAPSLLYRGALYCHFNDALLREKFPLLCTATNYLGITVQKGIPQVISCYNQDFYITVCYPAKAHESGEYGYGIDGYYSYVLLDGDRFYQEASFLTMVRLNGADYLVATLFSRQTYYEKYQWILVGYYRIRPKSIVFSKEERFYIHGFPHGEGHTGPMARGDFGPNAN